MIIGAEDLPAVDFRTQKRHATGVCAYLPKLILTSLFSIMLLSQKHVNDKSH